ncbi:MAG: tripartite tricarboxylate transporter TctB family protein [Candidatus Helarchaeota archaeon]
MNLKKIDSEYIIYTVLIGGAIFLYLHSFRFDQRAQFLREGTVLPGYWPRLILVSILILSLVLLIIKAYKDITIKGKTLNADKQLVATSRVVLIVLICFIYANIVNYIGYLLGTVFFSIILLFIMGVRKTLTLIFYPIGITIVVYLIFTKILYMSLPRGIGFFYKLSQLFY